MLPFRQPFSSLLRAVQPSPLASPLACRFLRSRARPSENSQKVFTLENPVTSKNWPPLESKEESKDVVHPKFCRELLHHLRMQELEKMKTKRTFVMPDMNLGDLVEVRYELSRTNQTFAVFQGYVIEKKEKDLYSSFTLKNTYDGIGVEQLFPIYSPRLLDVRVVRKIGPDLDLDRRPRHRDYRFQWQYYRRSLYSEGHEVRWKQIPQKPGVMSLEPRMRRTLALIRRRYQMQRLEAGLPPYVWPGPYHITRRRTREVKAERYRRMLIYAWDERRQRAAKLKRRAAKTKWGVYQINKDPEVSALTRLPSYHPLVPGNLPK